MTQKRLSLVIGAVLLVTTTSLAQPGPARKRAQGQKGPPPACQQMMDELQAMDTRFDEHVKRMNETQGAEKIDAIAAALNELAAQHRTMREHMTSMPCPGMKGGKPGCPMMAR
jgi:hypothetical protein